MYDKLTIKHADVHQVKLTIFNSPIDLTGGTVEVHVTPSTGGAAQIFSASLAGNVVTWLLPGTIAVGRYKMEVKVTVSTFVVTAPSDGYMELVVLQDLT